MLVSLRSLLRSVLLFGLFFLLPYSLLLAEDSPSTTAPIGDFVDQVLYPLAGQISEDFITHYKFNLTHLYAKNEREGLQKSSTDMDALFYRMFDLAAPGSGLALEGVSRPNSASGETFPPRVPMPVMLTA